MDCSVYMELVTSEPNSSCVPERSDGPLHGRAPADDGDQREAVSAEN